MKKPLMILLFSTMLWASGCQETESATSQSVNPPAQLSEAATASAEQLKEQAKSMAENQTPTEWGPNVSGVIQRLPTSEKVIALTFDACGGEHGSKYDQKLIDHLVEEKVPATLFVNYRWIEANEEIFMELAKNPLFEIENHGTQHRPLSVTGKSIYGIQGTQNIDEVIDEVTKNEEKVFQLTGRKPKFFRAGTAYVDDVSVQITEKLGEQIVNYDIIGDAGATFSASQVEKAMLEAKPGSIVLLHFNQPSQGTAEGLIKAIPQLKKQGFQFVKLEDHL
ncbi:polysaccharide deacetylase family protein [Hazenella coriacea]|uniref:Peptidoglycan/xylan/chitin deacetylase (PgdA/CDA1 family) n=1 Tax=Hazenella coriacea TaxID=1179467 RepID=A0A4R3L989_9BACL|nr:polysaccharide deacetylase family protein [Hazenella coriacea]TCS95665.1 peptidoglycan/xylan/chitin deacetylase (PgdA/CDA1 family) [Hazenella coriacea]